MGLAVGGWLQEREGVGNTREACCAAAIVALLPPSMGIVQFVVNSEPCALQGEVTRCARAVVVTTDALCQRGARDEGAGLSLGMHCM